MALWEIILIFLGIVCMMVFGAALSWWIWGDIDG